MQSPSFKFFFSSSEGSSGSDCDTFVGVGRVGVKVLLEEFSVITVVGLVLEKTVLIG